MSERGVKRRGKPNRGGGRFNKPQERGRGRGRGGPPGGRGRGSGRGGRGAGPPSNLPTENANLSRKTDLVKGGLDDYYDEVYNDEPADFEPMDRRRMETLQNMARGSKFSRGRPGRRKVELQQLHMTTDNQEMVRETLRQLHEGSVADEPESVGEDEYDELDVRLEDQYWMTSRQLKVVDDTLYDSAPQGPLVNKLSREMDLCNQWRVDQLQRYGFDRNRCVAALEKTDGDIGKALEYLLCCCFNLEMTLSDEDEGDYTAEEESDVDWNDIRDQRNEEKTALSSIYEDSFQEKVPNEVWSMKLKLQYLTDLFKTSHLQSHFNKPKLRPDVCKFYLQGRCRFGDQCRKRHEVLYVEQDKTKADHLTDDTLERPYRLEIRFPKNNKYPLEPPMVAFASHNKNVPNSVCLNITEQVLLKAAEMAADSLPSVFSMMSVLEDENEIRLATRREPPAFSFPQPVISSKRVSRDQPVKDTPVQIPATANHIRDVPLKNDNSVNREEQDETKTKYKPNSPTKSNDISQMKTMNKRIKDRFFQKQKTAEYNNMLSDRQKLPAWSKRKEIVDIIQENQVVVICGMTGCGKTTQVPQYLLDDSLHSGNVANIMCTQPRRISATAVAERVADERVDKLGNVVGYQIRLETRMSQWTRLLFCTTGILLRRMESDESLVGLTHIILDEVHERTEESDFLIMVLRDLLRRRRDLKVILMSATVNADLFSNYFGKCPVIEIPGRTFPVEQFYLEDAIEFTEFVMDERSKFARPLKHANASREEGGKWRSGKVSDFVQEDGGHGPPAKDTMMDQNLTPHQMGLRYSDYSKPTIRTLCTMDFDKVCYDLIEDLIAFIVFGEHGFPQTGGILVFLPGMQEITTVYEQLQQSRSFSGANKKWISLIPLHSTLSSEEQHAVFRKPEAGVRKIVLSTNIAETSITIDDIVFVIDCGKMKEKRYDSTKGMESLDVTWVSKANALQRKGRAGRVMAGVCFHLFTSHNFDFHLRKQPVPEIQRVPLERLCLQIKTLQLFKGHSLEGVMRNLLEPPKRTSMTDSIKRLQDLGALDADEALTALGFHLALLPVDVRIGKLMLFGAIFRCLDATLTIAATLSYRSPFVSPFDKRSEADKKKLEFAVGNSDHLTVLQAYNGWMNASKMSSHAGYMFCMDNFLSIKNLQMLASMKRQFVELLSDIGFVSEGIGNRDMERLSRNGGDGVVEATGPESNGNNKNMKLVSAILVAALYPNVVRVMTPETKYSQTQRGAIPKAPNPEELKFSTKTEYNVAIHPSSVNFQVRHYESPYLVYHEKIKTSRVYIRDCTMVSVYPLLLFGGGSISIDLSQGNFIMSVDDGWIRFLADSREVAQLVKELRLELDQLLQDKIEQPQMNLATCPRGSKIIKTIVKLVTTQ